MATDNRVLQNGSTEKAEHAGLEIDLLELLYRLLEKARYIILAALLGALLMGIYTYRFVTPTYKATSRLYIVNSKDSVINLTDLQVGANLASDYLEVFKAREVIEQVKEELKLPYTVAEIRNMVTASRKTNTRILDITVTSTNAQEAADMAEAFAARAQVFITDVMKGRDPTFFEHAKKPAVPSAPNKVRNIALGFIVGALAAIVILVIQFIADDRIRNVEMLEKRLGLPVLGMMPAAGGEESGSSRQHSKSKRKSSHRTGGKGGRT